MISLETFFKEAYNHIPIKVWFASVRRAIEVSSSLISNGNRNGIVIR